jgi:PAS domain S-box-containing protein
MLYSFLNLKGYPFSLSSYLNINRENPFILLYLLSPIVILSTVAYIIGSQIKRIRINEYNQKNNFTEKFETIHDFIEKIRKGEIEESEEIYITDKITHSLINLKKDLEVNKTEDESRKKEEFQRSWTSEGLAHFGAILREYNENIEILAHKVVSESVKYVDAKQAAFFIIDYSDQNNWKINEISNFAEGRKKLAEKELLWGEGLIGACIAERKSIFLNDIKESYLEIESGLGSSKPRSILIVPLMTQEGVIHGALELACFKVLEKYEIEFVEKLGESIATTISNIKINRETTRLLTESREQAEILRVQEEELRKTISDMRRLQENADIQSIAFRSYQDATNRALIRAEYNTTGQLLFANKRFLDLFSYKSNSEIQNKHISQFIKTENENWFNEVNHLITIENKHFEGLMNHVSKEGKDIWIESTYIGERNDKGKVDKILFLGIDATQLKLKSEELNARLGLINESLFKLELSPDFKVQFMSKKMADFLSFSEKNILDYDFTNFIPETEKQSFLSILENVKERNQVFEGQITVLDNNKNHIILRAFIFNEKDVNKNVVSFSIFAYNYTQESIASTKVRELENLVESLNNEITDSRERVNKRIESAREEMKELYSEIETTNILYKSTFDQTPDGIISINHKGEIDYLNQSVLEIWDFPEDDFTGTELSTLIPISDIPEKEKYLGEMLKPENITDLLGDRQETFIINSKGKKVELTMLAIEGSVGLRTQITLFLERRD